MLGSVGGPSGSGILGTGLERFWPAVSFRPQPGLWGERGRKEWAGRDEEVETGVLICGFCEGGSGERSKHGPDFADAVNERTSCWARHR